MAEQDSDSDGPPSIDDQVQQIAARDGRALTGYTFVIDKPMARSDVAISLYSDDGTTLAHYTYGHPDQPDTAAHDPGFVGSSEVQSFKANDPLLSRYTFSTLVATIITATQPAADARIMIAGAKGGRLTILVLGSPDRCYVMPAPDTITSVPSCDGRVR